jgi:hypothetical protein
MSDDERAALIGEGGPEMQPLPLGAVVARARGTVTPRAEVERRRHALDEHDADEPFEWEEGGTDG